MKRFKKTKATLKEEEKRSKGFKVKIHIAVKYKGIRNAKVEDLVYNLSESDRDIIDELKKWTWEDNVDYVTFSIYNNAHPTVAYIHGRINVADIQEFRKKIDAKK